ncbi:MAG: tRNA guanosine(34) transglycosylase Tgt [Anaeromyxobacteraceae bacterium]|nr:tRNA guanosine(34) transglycosylase Tgt [Anaeromyxobacteraceae bacterium]
MPFAFHPGVTDPGSAARRGAFVTPHGRVETPAFMPVGTRATVTGLTPEDLHALGAEIILGNTYHLLLRPGPEAMRRFGGLHRFMGWDRPILTDSGGFQIFSLPSDRTITEEGARFKSYIDCRYHHLSPESSIAMQEALGSDVMMVLDICLPSTAEPAALREAMDRTHRWALRSLAARTNGEQALFAIVQGGLSPAMRQESARLLSQHPFDGFAIGGLAVGDTRAERFDVVGVAAGLLPRERPRYLMGVGTPPDILEAVGHGVDMFDCVIPTTLAWQGTAFTSTGRVRLTRMEHRLSDAPLDAACGCPTCHRHPRGYLHHLVKCKEPLGPRLLSVHNLHHYLELMRAIRAAIEAGRYAAFARETMAAIDRHEHDASGRSPGRKVYPGVPAAEAKEAASEAPLADQARFTIVTTSSGAPSVRDAEAGEVMHPVIGAAVEAERLYVAQSRLAERLAGEGPPLVLFDVGLGAAGNALAALRAARAVHAAGGPARALAVVSFERELGALRLACTDEGAARLGWSADDLAAARAVLETGRHEAPGLTWRLALGEAPGTLAAAPERADVVFWDPFSPKANPGLWTVEAFAALRTRAAPGCTLFTYSTATSTRSALLLAGFHVGVGDPSGPKEETTAAAVPPAAPARPLDARWLARLARSSAAWPPDAPPDALDRVRAHPQFA